MRRRNSLPLTAFWLILSAIYCLTVTVIEFHDVPIVDFHGFLRTAGQFLLCSTFTAAFLLLLCSHRLLFAILFPPLAVVSAAVCYFFLTIHTRLTGTTLEIALINDATMWWTMVSPGLAAVLVGALAFAVFAAVVRWKRVRASAKAQWVAAGVGLAVSAVPAVLPGSLYGLLGMRMPYALYFATRTYLKNRSEVAEIRDTYTHTPAEADAQSPDVFFVLGESLRADHLPMNGYSRNTMPHLSREERLVVFPNVCSDYIHTDISVPHILTRHDPDRPNAVYTDQSFITLFRNAGYHTAWLANQSLSKSYSYFGHEADTLIFAVADRSTYSYAPWLDAELLPPLHRWLADGNAGRRMALLHCIGSHWWYPSHYSRSTAQFLPDAEHNDAARLSHDVLVNSYDNTILATDEFLYNLLRMVSNRNAIIFYISDHGEALGENGALLHGTDVPPLHHPACLVLYTAAYEKAFPDRVKALRRNRLRQANTTDVFHTLLHLAAINTEPLDSTRSLAH